MKSSQQCGDGRPQPRGTDRSLARRAELIAIGRKLFANTSYDVLSMDDIAKHAGVAKGLIYYYFKSKRGYYLAIIEDSVAELVSSAAGSTELPSAERVHRTIDGYLHYAELHQAAFRAIITGGVGFDAEVYALRDRVREAIIGAIAEGAWGSRVFERGRERSGEAGRGIPALARMALLGWLCGVEGITLDWISHQYPSRETVRRLLARTLRLTLHTIEEFEPVCPAPTRTDPTAGHEFGAGVLRPPPQGLRERR